MSLYDELTFAPVYVVDLEGKQEGIFRPHKGKRLIKVDRLNGNTPFVGASRMNNSITDFAHTPALFPGGWLTLIYNGDGGTGHARFQPAPFSASDDVIALEPRSSLASEPALLLMASMLTHQCVEKFSFGYKLTLDRLKRQKIMAPVLQSDEGKLVIDWLGLARLGQSLMHEAKRRARAVQMSQEMGVPTPPALTYAPMLITDVFTAMRATTAWYDRSKLSMTGTAAFPFVSRSAQDNGIVELCPRQVKAPEAGNAITIGLDTQTIAYQPAPFYTSQNIQVLRHELLNVDNGLVLVTLIRQQMSRFGWGGNGATLGRLRRSRIMVPVTADAQADGEPIVDWAGMSLLGRHLRAKVERSIDAVLK